MPNDPEDTAWMARGLCRQTDPDGFYAKGRTAADAKRTCLRCDVRAECLEYALGHKERFGIWGGLSERERTGLLKAAQSDSPPTCVECGEPHGGSANRKYCDTHRDKARNESRRRSAKKAAA